MRYTGLPQYPVSSLLVILADSGEVYYLLSHRLLTFHSGCLLVMVSLLCVSLDSLDKPYVNKCRY